MARSVKKKVVEVVPDQPEDTSWMAKTETTVVEVKEEPKVELIPKFAKVEAKRIQEEARADKNQERIKALRSKLENGTILDGEAQELFRMLSDK